MPDPEPTVSTVDDTPPEKGELVIVNKGVTKILAEAGLTTPDEIIARGIDELVKIDGIGKATAEKILAECEAMKKAALDEQSDA